MRSWEESEKRCEAYLNENYSTEKVVFKRKGGHDSNVCDILVMCNNRPCFFMDVKQCSSQAGQFVLFPDYKKGRFVFSEKNKESQTESCLRIIDMMNSRFLHYADEKRKKLPLPADYTSMGIYASWIVDFYREKGARFFIFENKKLEYFIFPIESLLHYCSVNGCYRVKKSGTRTLPVSERSILKEFVERTFPTSEIIVDGEKFLFTVSPNLESFHDIVKGMKYFFACDNGLCEVRKESKTFNRNVIFQLSLNEGVSQRMSDLLVFEQALHGIEKEK